MLYKIVGCILVFVSTIIAIIVIKVQSKKWMAEKSNGGGVYFVRTLPVLSTLMAGGAVMFLCFAAGSLFVLDGNQLAVALLIFLGFVCLEMAAYFCTMFWMIVVNEETGILIYYRPPLRALKIHISEVTRIQILENRLNSPEQFRIKVYRGEKKLFEVTDMMQGFGWLREYLEKATGIAGETGFYDYDSTVGKNYKIEKGYLRAGEVELAKYKEAFTVTATTVQKVWSGIATLLLLAMDALFAINREEWSGEDSWFFFCFAAVLFMTVMSMSDFIPKVLFRISVSRHEISIRRGIRKEVVYTKREITKVKTKGNFIVLYMGGRRLAKVSKEYKNAIFLAEWLDGENELRP